MKLTPYRRECLERLAETEQPLPIDDVMCGHPNIMPTLIRAGWAVHANNDGDVAYYEITDMGRAILGK